MATCTLDMEAALLKFAVCGCKVEKEPYTSVFMNALMAENWDLYCSNVVISCDGDTATLLASQWAAIWKLLADADGLTDAQKAQIKQIIADVINVQPDDIGITVTRKERRR
eukprot:392297_1